MTPGLGRNTAATHPSSALRRLAPALLGAVFLAACGGGGSSAPGDTVAPTVAITDSVAAATATGDVTFTFTFSEDVGTSFIAADVTVTGGTKGVFTKVSGTVTTLVVVPTASAQGTINVSVAAGAFIDAAGNPNTGTAGASQPYDTRVTLTQMALPVSFDSATVEYGLVGFGGADEATIAVDPAGGANQVAKVVKSATAETWAGTTITAVAGNVQTGFSSKVAFDAANTRMTVRVYSPDAGIPVRLKLEDHASNTTTVETEATTTASNAWETLTFDFAHQAAGTAALDVTKNFDKASIFFNFGTSGATVGAAKTYYFDDLTFIGGGGTGGGTPTPFATVTFDAAGVTYTFVGFGGAEDSSLQTDPSGASNTVARVVKSATAELWAGTTVVTGASDSVGKLPFDAANTRMTVRVWSPDAGIPVRLKVEDAANGTHACETEATTTTAGAWETLTFDFANPAAGTASLNFTFNYDKASIFFNFGTTGATAGGAKTYYFDDLTFIGGTGGGGGGATFAPVTFDDGAVTYTLLGFGGADDSTVVVDPTDAANHVGRALKSATAELWAGTTIATGANNSVGTFPFAVGKASVTLRVWSPDAGIPVRLKVEDAADPTHSCETEATVTVASGWQMLTFNFATQAAGTAALNLAFTYNKASVFFNFGTTGAVAGAKTYYFDDLAFVP